MYYGKVIIGVIIFLFIANWVSRLLRLLFDSLLAPKFYMRVNSITLFKKEYECDKDTRKWKYVRDVEHARISHSVVFDLNHNSKLSDEAVQKAEFSLMIIGSIIVFLISIGAFIVGFLYAKTLGGEGLQGLARYSLVAFITGFLFHSTVGLGIALYSIYKVKTSLAGYLQMGINKIRAGQLYENLALKSAEELDYKNVNPVEKILYFYLYFMYVESIGQKDTLSESVKRIEPIMDANRQKYGINRQYVGSYYCLLYYYSFHEPFVDKADYYFDLIKEFILKDTDVNAYRVLGFYHLIRNEVDAAQECAQKARVALAKMKTIGSIKYEEDCVNKLLMKLTE